MKPHLTYSLDCYRSFLTRHLGAKTTTPATRAQGMTIFSGVLAQLSCTITQSVFGNGSLSPSGSPFMNPPLSIWVSLYEPDYGDRVPYPFFLIPFLDRDFGVLLAQHLSEGKMLTPFGKVKKNLLAADLNLFLLDNDGVPIGETGYRGDLFLNTPAFR